MRTARFFAFCIALFLSACAPVLAVPPSASQNAPARMDEDGAYLINPGDTLKLTVYGEDTLNGSYIVDRRGAISVPLAGNVYAAGFSKDALEKDIADRLIHGGYLNRPIVTVDVTGMRPFYILGEVKNPGSYAWQPSIDVFKAIAMAGGYTPRAAENKILIDRGDGAQRKHMNGIETTPVMPGDSITVRERIF